MRQVRVMTNRMIPAIREEGRRCIKSDSSPCLRHICESCVSPGCPDL